MAKEPKVCNVEHKMNPEGTILQNCKNNPPGKARYARAGLYVCEGCWPDILMHFQNLYPSFGALAAKKAFKRV